jgi:hypothetical protein
MSIFVSKRGLEKRRAAQENRQLAAREILEDISSDGTAIWRDPTRQYAADQVVQTQCAGLVGLAYGLEVLIEDTEEYLRFDKVTVIRGSKVVLQYEDGYKYTYYILGSEEGDVGNGIISCDCEFAKKLLGLKKDQTFEYEGQKIKILSVERI